MESKQFIEISKCLANNTRLQIMEWLKEPDRNFPPNDSGIPNSEGVCVSYIQEKSGLSQSTISTYLGSMERCGLLNMKRAGKWSYFSLNKSVIESYTNYLK